VVAQDPKANNRNDQKIMRDEFEIENGEKDRSVLLQQICTGKLHRPYE
jgi:hypothetical protein